MVSLPPFFSSSYELLPSSSSEAVEGIKTRAKQVPRGVLYFLGAQLTLVLLAGFLFSSGGRPPPPPHGGPGGDGLGPYQWGGFDEMCVGEFGTYVCEEYGPHNVKLSRSYEGTGTRFREVFRRVQQENLPLRVAVLGGSVSGGHGIGDLGSDKIWIRKTYEAMDAAYPHPDNSLRNAAVGAVGSDYFGACWENRIKKEEVDIVFVEHGINDFFGHDAALSMEDLLRGLLDLPQRPAVLIARTIGLEADMIAVGGDEHLSVGTYYDVPVISLRPVLLPLLIKQPERDAEYFVRTNEGNIDHRHINEKGHHALGDFIGSYVLDQFEVASHQLRDLRASGHEDWRQLFGKQKAGKHDWPGPEGLGDVPKLRLFQKYDPDAVVVPMRTQCLTMDQGEFVSNPLLPALKSDEGWSQLDKGHDKTYLWAETPGSTFEVELDVTGGKVEIYYLRAGAADYRLGSVECWIDDDVDSKRRFDGWWDDGNPHIGQFGVVAEGLSPGKHTLSCEVMEDSVNPHGGTEFRIISVVAL
ncbi:hypothetical protein BDY24DRAFT_375666 [Mrakia frigida]|uniref:SGNH/GDSL hydrolase family protein n=1 Tax=Mrakia frigida TaxID=29902 RepID=UPI003FCBFAC0